VLSYQGLLLMNNPLWFDVLHPYRLQLWLCSPCPSSPISLLCWTQSTKETSCMWVGCLQQSQMALPVDGSKHLKSEKQNHSTGWKCIAPVGTLFCVSVSMVLCLSLMLSAPPLKTGWWLPWPDRSWNQSGCVENRWKCKHLDNDEQDWSSSKSTPLREVSKIYVCKGKFYKTFKEELTPVLKLFHTIVKKGSSKLTLWATLPLYQKQERINKLKLEIKLPNENILNKMFVQWIHKHIKILPVMLKLDLSLGCTSGSPVHGSQWIHYISSAEGRPKPIDPFPYIKTVFQWDLIQFYDDSSQ
jgi:hypothetical protein